MKEYKREYQTEKRECSIVLVGNFNPAMFSTNWFVNNHIMREEDSMYAQSQNEKFPMIVSNQLTMFKTTNYTVKIELNRFQIISNKESYLEILDFVCKTFENLSSFSFKAYGFNYSAHYPLKDRDEYINFGDKLAPKSYWEFMIGDDLKSENRTSGLHSMKIVKNRLDGSTSMDVQQSVRFEYGIFLACNDHYNVKEESSDADTVVSQIKEKFEKSLNYMSELQIQLLHEVNGDE